MVVRYGPPEPCDNWPYRAGFDSRTGRIRAHAGGYLQPHPTAPRFHL